MRCLALPVLLCAGTALAETARFEVTDRVINPELQPFTATISVIGNGHRLLRSGGGFEPAVFRTMLWAREDAPDRIIAEPSAISHWDSWRSGALDGAEVEVLRIEHGAFRTVRRDRVAPGGHQASDWIRIDDDAVLPAGRTSYRFAWDGWNRADAPYYFTVRAVDTRGAMSEPAAAVAVRSPADIPRDAGIENDLVEMPTTRRAGRLEAPENLRGALTGEGFARIDWDPVPGAAGYVVYRADAPPEAHRGHYLALEGEGPAIRDGDMVILRKQFMRADRARVLTNHVWDTREGRPFRNELLPWSDAPGGDWELVEHPADSPVADAGSTHLRVRLDAGETLTAGAYNHAGTAQSWYPVLSPAHSYRMEVWMRGSSSRAATFEVTGVYGRGVPGIDPVRFEVTPEWRRYEATFDVPALYDGTRPGEMRLRLDGPGEVDIDNLRIHRADAAHLDLLPEDVARLKAFGMGALRTHGFIKTGRSTYDLAELTNPGGVANTRGGNTLPQILGLTERVGMDPWLQIESHFSRAEWLGLAEYLAAPFDPDSDDAEALPWAAKRAAQGDGPWTERFERILFELGNETWNRLFRPWVFEPMRDAATGAHYSRGAVYGLYQEYVLSILRESPHWPRLGPRLVPVLGGWSGFDFGIEAAAQSPNSEILAHAAYIGGWDENEGPVTPTPAGLFTVLSHVLQSGLPRAERYAEAVAQLSRGRETPLQLGTYEAGPGYAMDGLNNDRVTDEEAARQERAMKSAAAGTATLDSFLAYASRGMTLQNFFTYGSGERWTSHAHWYHGGQSYPSWEWLALFNREGLGDMLAVETLAVPRADLPEMRRREAVTGAPMVGVYATRRDDRLVVVAISRRLPGHPDPGSDGVTALSVMLPVSGADRVIRHRRTGAWDSHNVDAAGTRLVAEEVPVPGSLPEFEIPHLPPGQAQIYVFEGVR